MTNYSPLDNPTIPAEVRGKLRLFKNELAQQHKTVQSNLNRDELCQAMISATLKTSKTGRHRSLQRIYKMLPGVRLEWQTKSYSLFSALRARSAVIADPRHRGERQDSVCMDFIITGESLIETNTTVMYRGLWTLEVPDHALVRMFQRDPNINMRKALYQAHDWLLKSKSRKQMPDNKAVLYLPAGDGVFLGQIISGIGEGSADNDLIFFYRARTWLSNDQTREDQKPMWPGKGNNCFGKKEMLPGPLRLIREVDQGVYETLQLPKPAFRNSLLELYNQYVEEEGDENMVNN